MNDTCSPLWVEWAKSISLTSTHWVLFSNLTNSNFLVLAWLQDTDLFLLGGPALFSELEAEHLSE